MLNRIFKIPHVCIEKRQKENNIMSRCIFLITLCLAMHSLAFVCQAQTTFFSLPLTTSSSNKLDIGTFSGGSLLSIAASGQGALAPGGNFSTFADGSLAAVAQGVFADANQGASYPTYAGGDGINHLVGGGAICDFGDVAWGFAGKQTTDTTDPAVIRYGAIVGTFDANPSRIDWFVVGTGNTIIVPTGGATLYLAVNDSYSPDNQGTYTGSVSIASPVPEPGAVALLLAGGLSGAGLFLRRRRKKLQM